MEIGDAEGQSHSFGMTCERILRVVLEPMGWLIPMKGSAMAKLDNDDLRTIRDLIEVTFEEVIDRNGVATKDHIGA